MTSSPGVSPSPSSHTLLRLMLTGFLCGIISALIASSALLALSDARFLASVTSGSALHEFSDDLTTAVLAAFLWYLPVGIFVFPPVAKFLGAASSVGTLRLLKFVALGAILWFLLAWTIYLVLSPLAPAPPGVERSDLISATLSGAFFGIVYDLLLRRRDYLLMR